eukprot:7540802-Karenia_brevis.AAC.1
MVATKHLGVLSKDRLGVYLERILEKYRESVGSSIEGVPHGLLHTATQIDANHLTNAREGPGDTSEVGLSEGRE